MTNEKHQLISKLLDCGSLKIGDFTLKSGRKSPYFFNSGLLCEGKNLALVGKMLGGCLTGIKTFTDGDLLYAAPYKGITLASVTSVNLAARGIQSSICYSRKEIKEYGEGGFLIGAAMKEKRIWIIDDVLTAGTALKKAIHLIGDSGGIAAGILIIFDRKEHSRQGDSQCASESLSRDFSIPVRSLFTLDDLIDVLKKRNKHNEATKLETHRQLLCNQTI